MAFVISKKQTYPWAVVVKTPDPARPGKWLSQTFTAMYRRYPPLVVQEMLSKLAGRDMANPEEMTPEEREAREWEFLDEVLLGWDGISDDEGVPVPCTPETRPIVLNIIEVRRAIFNGFFDSAMGKKDDSKNKADVKN